MRNLWDSQCDQNSWCIGGSSLGQNGFAMVERENIILGATNQTQWRGRPASTNANTYWGTTPTTWKPWYNGGARVSSPSLTLDSNKYEFGTNPGAGPIDVILGNAIRMVDPGSNAITIGKSGSVAATMAKLGLETPTTWPGMVQSYPVTAPSTYIGGALFQHNGVNQTAPNATDPLTGAALLAGATTAIRLSNSAAPFYSTNTPLVNGDVITVNGIDFTCVTGSSANPLEFGLADTIATTLGKIAAATGLTVDLVAVPTTIVNNKSLLRGVSVP